MKEKNENIIKSKITETLHLDKCLTAAHPEMARNSDEDEPCDDDRS